MVPALPGRSATSFPIVGVVRSLIHRIGAWWRKTPLTMHPAIKLDAVLAAMMDAVVISDRDGRFIDFNEAFAKLNKFKSKNECLVALTDYPSIFNVSKLDGTHLEPEQWPIQRALRGEFGEDLELLVERGDLHETFVATVNFAPIRVNGGDIVGAVLTGRDTTEAHAAEENLRNISSRLHLALSSAHLGVWEWDILHNRLTWDDRMFELYGVDRAHFTTSVEAWVAPLHPEDRDAAVQLLQAAVRRERDRPRPRSALSLRKAGPSRTWPRRPGARTWPRLEGQGGTGRRDIKRPAHPAHRLRPSRPRRLLRPGWSDPPALRRQSRP